MKSFLEDYIVSLSGKRQDNIHEIMSAARANKQDLNSLAEKLTNIRKQAPIVISSEVFGSSIQATKFDGAYRDAYRHTLELYQVSNLISLLLDSHSSVLTSEIKALEDELLAMEKAVNNYAFTLSDNGAYDYAFTETFNDDTMLETNPEVILTDRSGINFTTSEIASVNSSSGILTLSPSLKISYPLLGTITDNNCLGLATSNTGLTNSLNTAVNNGWRVAVSAPRPISSRIGNSSKQGAQIELELSLASASPCDTIILTPFSDIAIEILQIKVLTGIEEDNVTYVLNSPTVLDRPLTVNFPLQSVSKFKILINQSVYSRGSVPPVKEEVIYRDFAANVKDERKQVASYMGREYLKNKKALKRVFLHTKKDAKNVYLFRSEIPQLDFDATHGPLTIDKIMKRTNESFDPNETWSYRSKISTFMKRMIDESVFGSNGEILNDRYTYNTGMNFTNSLTSIQASLVSGGAPVYPDTPGVSTPLNADILSYPVIEESQYLNYQYNLGLRNIQIGTGIRIFRGVFVLKEIPAPSDSGEVKVKADDINFNLLDTSRDSVTITSTEYSISNKSTPKKEEDWIPILPIDTKMVTGERLFFDETGSAYFRFLALSDNGLTIYKNGYKIDFNKLTIIRSSDYGSIKGVQLGIGSFLPTDIFTIDYFPSGDSSIVNFADKGFGQVALASAYDDAGAGETFSSTFNNQIITLQNEPYISYEQVKAEGAYSLEFGFTGLYQPITVVLSDGTTALNQTNYLGFFQNNLSSFPETTTAFIHSGKNLIFNKPITESFTVYYQYLPSNLRLRVVLRVNDINYVSPIVNSVQIKTKTLKANARKEI